MIGSTHMYEANWNRFKQSVTTRLILASQKTNSVPDRIQVISTIFLPGYQFVVKFILPNEHTITKLQNMVKNFIWRGTTKETPTITDSTTPQTKCRWKIDMDVLNMKKNQGGIGLINLKQATIKAAISKILTWDLKPNSIAKWAGEFLLNKDKQFTTNNLLIIPTYIPSFRYATRNMRSKIR